MCAASGCVGGGDDTTAPAASGDAGDAGEAAVHDGPAGDAPGAAGEGGGSDALARDAGLDATVQDTFEGGGGQPAIVMSAMPIDFGAVNCGTASVTQTLTVANQGSAALALSATTTGTAFSVSPGQLTVTPGSSGTLTIAATVQASATAGAVLTGSLGVFTNDPGHGNVAIRLSATPAGATIALGAGSKTPVDFPATPVGGSPATQTFTITNQGNAPSTITVSAPSPVAGFSFLPGPLAAGVPMMVAPQASVTGTVQYSPTSATSGLPATSTSTVTQMGAATCGTSLSSISFSGSAVPGSLTGWPPLVDFGNANCGGGAPAPQTFVLVNTGAADETITACTLSTADGVSAGCNLGGAPDDASMLSGFGVSVPARTIPANGGSLVVTVTAPAVSSTSSLQPIQATLSLTVDPPTSPSLAPIALREEPTGAVLAFDPAGVGSFGNPIVLLGPQATQAFNVVNTGNWPPSGGASVALAVVPNDSGEVVDGAVDAGPDATMESPQAFRVLTPMLTVPPGGARNDTLLFSPLVAGVNSATLSMTVDPATPLCAPLPSTTLIGTGIGGGASIVPTSLSLLAPCDGTPPASQPFTVTNSGSLDLNWAMGSVTGPGAARYSVVASPPPGLLRPGERSTVTVSALPFLALPQGSAPLNPDPAGLVAQIMITTDAPGPAQVVSLHEIPTGDQLSFFIPGSLPGSAASLQFGQFPVDQTTIPQLFGVANSANSYSSDGHFSLVVEGPGGGAYTLTPPSADTDLGAGAVSVTEGVTFAPSSAIVYPATIAITTADTGLCTPLPPPIQLIGTGTAGHVSVSPGILTFGEGTAGFVNCGATAAVESITVANTASTIGGNQPFNVVSIALGKQGAAAPFTFSTSAATPAPFGLAVGSSVAITVSPSLIPSVADPNDAAAFHDVLTITTDAAGDAPHLVPLIMQARGAVIANTPLNTAWNFGTINAGSIGTITSTFQNTGNASVSVALTGLAQPAIFGLQQAAAPASGFASIVGQFTPPALDGSWTDQGALVMTAMQAFCASPPPVWQAATATAWQGPTISLSGASNSNPPVRISGTALAFPTTDCGSAPPAGQTLTLTNNTNQTQAYTAQIRTSAHPDTYALGGAVPGGDGGTTSGTIAAMGVATILVTPNGVAPGPGVVAGSYAGSLEIDVATTPVTTYTVPLSWSMNGAVLSLTPGGTPFTDGNGVPFYSADTTSGHLLPMSNTGTAAVTIDFAIQPPGAFTLLPALPVALPPGIGASPQLEDVSSSPVCVPSPLLAGTATFIYASGPVCQPFVRASAGGTLVPTPAVSVHYCAGSF